MGKARNSEEKAEGRRDGRKKEGRGEEEAKRRGRGGRKGKKKRRKKERKEGRKVNLERIENTNTRSPFTRTRFGTRDEFDISISFLIIIIRIGGGRRVLMRVEGIKRKVRGR